MNRYIAILITLAGLAGTSLVRGEATVTAELEPSQISVGQTARLIIRLSGGDASAQPKIPKIDGVNMRPAGQSSQIRIVNGQMSSSVNFRYLVSPEREGAYEIPPVEVTTGGQTLRTEALKLRVLPSANSAPGTLKQPGKTPPSTAPSGSEIGKFAFLRVDRADEETGRDLYVGEFTPIAIRAYFLEGVRINLNSKPTLADPAFTLHSLSEKPQQGTTTVDGRRYRVLTWFAGISGVKAGKHSIEANLDATVGIPQPRNRNRRRSPFGNSPFDDPFFDSMLDDFFARVEQREVTLNSEKIPATVAPLPTDGRPADFDGAIGQFEIGAFNTPAELQTGDPVTLRVTVTGKGNFDRVSTPQLVPSDIWKTYDPKESTEPKDLIGYEARKSFELPAIALQPGTPEVRFSLPYFNPTTGEYQRAESAAVPLTITGAVVPGNALDASPTPASNSPRDSGNTLAPLRSSLGRVAADLTPLYRRNWFLVTQAVLCLVLLGALAMVLIRYLRNRDPDAILRRQTDRQVAEELRRLDLALLQHDAEKFFQAARAVIQLKLASKLRCNPASITAEDLARHLPQGAAAARVFNMADTVSFSAAEPPPDALEQWQRHLQEALAELDGDGSIHAGRQRAHWGEVSDAA